MFGDGEGIELCERNGFALVLHLLNWLSLSLQRQQSLNVGACQTIKTVSFEMSLPFFSNINCITGIGEFENTAGFLKLTW